MESRLIVLKKSDATATGDVKECILLIFKKLYLEVHDHEFKVTIKGQFYTVEYRITPMDSDKLLLKLKVEDSPIKAARVLDHTIRLFEKGYHRKDFNIILSYDAVSAEYCKRLMPKYGEFERRLRELVYLSLVNALGPEWCNKTGVDSVIKESAKGMNASELIERALEEMSYKNLEEYLFNKRLPLNPNALLEKRLSDEKMESMSKERLCEEIRSLRRYSLWDRYFAKYDRINALGESFDEIRKQRNIVMHQKRVVTAEYESWGKKIKNINKQLLLIMTAIEEDMYSDTERFDFIQALNAVMLSVGKAANYIGAIDWASLYTGLENAIQRLNLAGTSASLINAMNLWMKQKAVCDSAKDD